MGAQTQQGSEEGNQKIVSNLLRSSMSNPSLQKSLGALDGHMVQPLAVGDSCCVTVGWEPVFC